MIEFLAALAAFSLSLTGCAIVVRRRLGTREVVEGEVRWRTDAVPRLGGLAIMLGFGAGAAILAIGGIIDSQRAAGFLAGAAIMGAVGVWDDLRGLKPLNKLIGQIMATSVLLVSGTSVEIIDITPLAAILTFVWVIAITNAVNLLDNMDGLAGGVGVIAVGLLGVHAAIAGINEVVGIAAIVVAALFGFLPFNLKLKGKATLYMGDGGSQFLGFALAWLALAASWNHASSIIAAIAVPVLVLAIPILDTALVSVVRMIEGRPIYEGGRDHTSHRLVIYGLSERRAVLLLIAAAAAIGASSLLYTQYDSFAAVLVGAGLAAAVLVHFALFLVRASKQRDRRPPETAPEGRTWLSIETYRLHKRRFVEGLVDLVLIVAAYYLAYILRYDELPSEFNETLIIESLPFLIVARYVAFSYFGLYRGLWRYAGTRDVINVFKAVVVSEAALVVVLTLVYRFDGYSRTVFVINALLCFVFIAGSRLAERALGEWLSGMRDRSGVPSALIVGAGDAGNSLLRELRTRGEYSVDGFIDDDPAKQAQRAQGVPVVGTTAEMELILDRFRPEIVYVSIPDAPLDRLDRVEETCRRAGTRCQIVRSYEMPSPTDARDDA